MFSGPENMSHFITISSKDCLDIFRENNALNFIVQFDPAYEFRGKWVVSLIELFGLEAESDCVLDICAYILDTDPRHSQIQRLRRVFLKKHETKVDFPHLIYVNLNSQRIWRMRIFIKQVEGIVKRGENVYMTLHFMQRSM